MMETDGCNHKGDEAGSFPDLITNETLETTSIAPSLLENSTSSSSSPTPFSTYQLLGEQTFFDDEATYLPSYLRIICLVLIVAVFAVGTVGNIMVTLVISRSRDMRTSTNIFLVNLSIADLLVLVVCTPTALIEVIYHPERWVLGFSMCE